MPWREEFFRAVMICSDDSDKSCCWMNLPIFSRLNSTDGNIIGAVDAGWNVVVGEMPLVLGAPLLLGVPLVLGAPLVLRVENDIGFLDFGSGDGESKSVRVRGRCI
jgi:hypothetical protein